MTTPFSSSKNFVEDLVPAAEVVDGEQAGRLREVLARRVGALEHRPVAVLREDLLRLLAPDEVQERLASFGCLVVLVIAAGFSIRIVESGTR